MSGRVGSRGVALESSAHAPRALNEVVGAGQPAGRAAHALPEAPRRIRVGMPHLDAAGLSENWLLRYAGDLQWEAIARHLGVPSDEIRGAGGERLYPTVVAARGRYAGSLAAVAENDVLDASIEMVPAGRACAWGRIAVRCASTAGGAGDGRGAAAGAGRAVPPGDRLLSLELLTTFAVRDRAPGGLGLRMMPPAPSLASRWTPPEGSPPPIAQLARAARRGEPLEDAFAGPILARSSPAVAGGGGTGGPTRATALGSTIVEPSPYADYNGAGLLYFASYVTIADTAERQLVRRLGLADTGAIDWALGTSALRRDVYYTDNLPLGACLTVQLLAFDPDPDGITTHVRLIRTEDRRRMADVVTRRRWTSGRPPRSRP